MKAYPILSMTPLTPLQLLCLLPTTPLKIIYKSMSLEGSGNFANVVNAFTTSEFISPSGSREYINAGLVKNYGGINYAHLGRDPRIRPTADLKYMGFFGPIGFGVGFLLDLLVLGTDNLYMFPIQGPVVGVGQIAVGDKYSDISTSIAIANERDLEGTDFETAYQPKSLIVKIDSASVGTLGQLIQNSDIVSVFSLCDPKHCGDTMRGQYAEAHFTFPAQPFELYSLNLNYEPTSLDHSK